MRSIQAEPARRAWLTWLGAGCAAALLLPGCGRNRRAATLEPAPPAPPPSADSFSNGVRIRQIGNGTQITGDESLLFDTGKATIKPGGLLFLDKLARALREKPLANVLVEGHTDNVGTAAYNDGLSERRALAVRQALIDRNIAASRMSARGLGMSKPVADNGTPEGRAANRRTEIFIIGESIKSLD
jgi:outer membrane protein OmpA-like peptidoglycan-associated protein